MPAPIAIISVPAAQLAQAVVISEDWASQSLRPAAQSPAQSAAPSKPAPLPKLELTDKRLKLAVSETLAATPEKSRVAANRNDALLAPPFSADRNTDEFAKQIAYAKVPSCRGQDALKFQPPAIGRIDFGGVFAIPFVVVAKLRGKCN